VLYTKFIIAVDADNNNLTFSDNTTLFNIAWFSYIGSITTGIINFTPALSDVGTYSINITVTDSNLSDTEIFNFTIVRGPFCGDSSCTSTEDCVSCPQDCGGCVDSGIGDDDGGASVGGGDTGAAVAVPPAAIGFLRFCDEIWVCLDWSECINGSQVRTCADSNKCRTEFSKPEVARACFIEDKIPDTCLDGIQNAGEDGIDCGGPCTPCAIQRFAEIIFPPISLPGFARLFPWIIVLITALISTAMTTSDHAYLRHVRKLEFQEYRKKLVWYMPFRRKMYTTIVSMTILSFVYAIYFWYFSINAAGFRDNLWFPGILSVLVPLGVYLHIKSHEFSDIRRKIEEQRLKRVHERQLFQLEKLEIDTLLRIEERALDALTACRTQPELQPMSELKDEVKIMFDIHGEQIGAQFFDTRIRQLLHEVQKFPSIYSKYPELERMAQDLQKLDEIPEADKAGLIEATGNLKDSVEAVAKDKLLISVLTADPDTITHYNMVVDIFEYFEQIRNRRVENFKKSVQTMTKFTESFSDNVQGSEMAETQKENPDFIRANNRLVELFDHYQKKTEG